MQSMITIIYNRGGVKFNMNIDLKDVFQPKQLFQLQLSDMSMH